MTLAVAMSPVIRAEENAAQPAPQPADVPADVAESTEAAPQNPETELLEQLQTMNDAIEKARTEASQAADQRDAARKEAMAVRKAKQRLEAQLGGLKEQLDATNHEVGQWKEKARHFEEKLGAGEEAYQKLGTFRDEMNSALKEFAVLKNDLAAVRGELQAPAERVALKEEIAGLKTQNGEIARKLDEEVKAHNESKGLLAAGTKLAKELGDALDEMKTAAKAQLEKLAQTQRERDALAKNLTASNEQLTASMQEAAEFKAVKEAAEASLESTRAELASTQEMLAMLKKDASELRATMEPLAAGIQEAKEQAEKATLTIREVSAAREKAEREATQAKGQLEVANARLIEALNAQTGLRQEVASKTSEIDVLRRKVEAMEATTATEAEKTKNAGL